MPQLKSQVPDPLADNLPTLLATGGMRAPAIWLLFQVFIRQGRFKRASMQVERHHISSGEGILRQSGQEQFIDEPVTGVADAALLLPRRMRGNDDPAGLAVPIDGHRWTVMERAADPALRMGEVLIGRQVQASPHLVPVEQMIVLAPRHVGQFRQVSQDGSGTLLPIQAHHGVFWWDLVELQVGEDSCHRSA